MAKLKCKIVVFLAVFALLLMGPNEIFAEEMGGVVLYENEVKVGEFATVNEAFDRMTNANADYIVKLLDPQTLTGYAQWPKARSIEIGTATSEDGVYVYANPLYLTEAETTFNSDIYIANLSNISPSAEIGKSEFTNLYLQNYEMRFLGPYAGLGDNRIGIYWNTGFNIIGETGSKLVLSVGTQLWGCSIQVDTVDMATNFSENYSNANLYLEYPSQDSHIKNLYIKGEEPTAIEVHEYTKLSTNLIIEEIIAIEDEEEDFYGPEPTTLEIGGVGGKIEIGNATENVELSMTLPAAYTGTKIPRGIKVCGIYDEIKAKDDVLFYAPHISSDVITFDVQTYRGVTTEEGCYSGKLESDNGYYYIDDVPYIVADSEIYVIEESCQKTLTYTDANANGNLKSITWTAFHAGEDVTKDVIKEYDNDSVELFLDKKAENETIYLSGEFNYGYGVTTLSIPVHYSAPASNVSFSTSELKLDYAGSIGGSASITLNYTAEEEPFIHLTTSDESIVNYISREGNEVHFSFYNMGTAILRAYVGDEVAECKIIVKGLTGCSPSLDGNWYYYVDGYVDTTMTGLVPVDNSWWYVIEGRVAQEYTGWVEYEGAQYYVENGVVTSASSGYTGLECRDGVWYYVENGMINHNFTGLYCDAKLGWWLVVNGQIAFDYTGLWCDPVYGWWLIENGAVCFDYTGLWCDPNYGWWLIGGGAVCFDYTGLWCDPNYGWWLIGNGAVAFDYTGLWCDPNYGWWLVGGGAVCFDYTGLWCDPNYGWWLIGGGAVAFDYNGLWNDPNLGWWLVGGGTIPFGYTGLYYDTNLGWWYIQGGAVGFGYTGEVYYDGVPYYVVNGQLM